MTEHETGPRLVPGTRVRITQRVANREAVWLTKVEGEVIHCRSEPTGSWYAHGQDDRYWLSRVRLRKGDGAITTVILDRNSMVEMLPAQQA